MRKPAGKWCSHCDIGKGCKIHGAHPAECKNFVCEYLTWGELGERWRPSDSKMIVTIKGRANTITVLVDAGIPNAWREQPFYGEMTPSARSAAASRREGAAQTHILVVIGKRIVVIFPDRHIDLGVLADDERFIGNYRMTARGPHYEAVKMHKDDPRLAGRNPVGGQA